MDEQAPAQQNKEEAGTGSPATDVAPFIHCNTTEPTSADQLEAVEKEMSGFERSTLKWAKTAVVMSGIAALFVCAQWWEMHTGSADTHALAAAAEKQADRMKTQSDRTKDLVDRMRDQADHTKTLAEQATIQAKATEVAAEAAVSSSRAWMVPVGTNQTNPTTINLLWKNVGQSPALHTRATAEYDKVSPLPRFVPGCKRLLRHHRWMSAASIVLQSEPFEITLQNMPDKWNSPPAAHIADVTWIHGCVWYTDVLTNRERTSEFCYMATTISPVKAGTSPTTVIPCLEAESDPLIFR